MTKEITAPYNFVPLSQYVYVPDWGEQVTQDIPFSDGEDGVIEVKWKNVSPLCIRDASDFKEVDGCKVYYSMNIKLADGCRLFFIPGSSLRGMLRNTLNIMSFGKMTQYGDKYFGHREFDNLKNPKEKFGWLEKKGDVYYLYPCKTLASKVSMGKVKREFRDYDAKKDSAWQRNKAISEFNDGKYKCASGNYFPIIKDGYALYATGKMQGKLHELLIPTDIRNGIELTQEEVTSFLTIHECTPNFGDGFKSNLLDKGLKIPVCYLVVKDKDGKDKKALGLSHKVRQPYKYGVKDLVEKQQKPVDDYDLSGLIFGTVSDKGILKGRIQISNAFASVPLADNQLGTVVSGVLGEPKPSFFPLYLRQDKQPYMTYGKDDSQISGRKLYRIHKSNNGVKLPQGNGNKKTMSHMIPVPAEQEFTMRIVVHNLRKVEIGALLSAITYHRAPDTWHNIGSAKGYGYGKLECKSISFSGLKYKEEDYLKAYEYEMSVFTQQKYNEAWNETEPMKYLGAIASEHDAACVRMMEMDKGKSPIRENEYAFYSKKKGNFSKLTEAMKPLPTCLSDADSEHVKSDAEKRKRREVKREFKQKHKDEYEKLELWKSEPMHEDEAILLLNDLIIELCRCNCDIDGENELKSFFIKKKYEREERERQKKEEEKRKANEEKIAAGLRAFLNETYPGQPNKYKVNAWKICNSKVNSWLKMVMRVIGRQELMTVIGRQELNEKEKDILEETIKRFFEAPDKNEKKDWQKADSYLWKQIAGFLGKGRADQLMVMTVIGRQELNEKEKDILEETIKRLFEAPDRNEKKDWQKADSYLWKQIAGFLGKDRADQLYKELHG